MIHYCTGKEDDLNTRTRLGCGILFADMPRSDGSIFWKNRQTVDCPDCLVKIKHIERLNSFKKRGV